MAGMNKAKKGANLFNSKGANLSANLGANKAAEFVQSEDGVNYVTDAFSNLNDDTDKQELKGQIKKGLAGLAQMQLTRGAEPTAPKSRQVSAASLAPSLEMEVLENRMSECSVNNGLGVEMHHDYWHQGTTHVVGVAMEVHYMNQINTVEQTFVCGFHITLGWQPSKEEVESYKKAKAANEEDEWEPDYMPHIRFPNCLEFQQQEFETHLDGSTVELLEKGKYDTRGAMVDMELQYLLTATLNIRAKFGEPFELENFPFDVQDLKIILESCATSERQVLVPHFEKNAFIKINMDVSCLPDWEFDRAVAEFDLSDPTSSLYNIQFSSCTVNLKVVRRYRPYVERVMFMMCTICATMFTLFALDPVEGAGDRLSNAFGLLLAGMVFMFVVSSQLPNVPYLTILDKYIYSVFFFMLVISIECAVVQLYENSHYLDAIMFKVSVCIFVGLHVLFVVVSYFARKYELKKLMWTSEDYLNAHAEDANATPHSMTIESDNIREPHHNYWSHGDHVAKTHSHKIEHVKRTASTQSLNMTEKRDSQWVEKSPVPRGSLIAVFDDEKSPAGNAFLERRESEL